MNNNMSANLSLNDLPASPPPLVRRASVNQYRARIGSEQYFTSGSRDDPEIVKLIDYTRDCMTILECKRGTLYPHAFYNASYYGENIGLKLEVVDLATGRVLTDWEYNVESKEIALRAGCVYEGDVKIVTPMEGDLGNCRVDLELVG